MIVNAVKSDSPVEYGLPGHGWTVKKLTAMVMSSLKYGASRSTIYRILKDEGFSWKKCKKLLSKANPWKREAFIERFQKIFESMCRDEIHIIYVDESHFHQDLDSGYTWGLRGKPVWRRSSSPPLSARLNWYGAYDFSQGSVFIWHEGRCNGHHTMQFLQRLVKRFDESKARLVVIWDGAPWHRSKCVQDQAEELGIELIQLPSYSPDLNPIEGLWKWMREEVTQHYCHNSLHELFTDCIEFINRINSDPISVLNRLWPRFELDPDYEKLLVSTEI